VKASLNIPQEEYRRGLSGFIEQDSVTSTASDFELKQVFTGLHIFLGQSEHKTTQSPSEQCARSELCHNITGVKLNCHATVATSAMEIKFS
jgi:hypothetical protein